MRLGKGARAANVRSHDAIFTVPLSPADEDTKVPPRRRLYTASLPPEGYVPAPPEPRGSPASEDTSGSDDMGGGCRLPGEVWPRGLPRAQTHGGRVRGARPHTAPRWAQRVLQSLKNDGQTDVGGRGVRQNGSGAVIVCGRGEVCH